MDGIIQQIVRKHKNKLRPKWYGRINVAKDFNELEQELIEKIKQEFPFNTNKSTISDMTIRKILIGDNQE